MDELIDI